MLYKRRSPQTWLLHAEMTTNMTAYSLYLLATHLSSVIELKILQYSSPTQACLDNELTIGSS